MDSKYRQFNWYNFWVCWLVSLGQIAFGYPASIIGTTLGEPSFLQYFNLLDLETGGFTKPGEQIVGAFSGVFQVRSLSECLSSSSADRRPGWSRCWHIDCELCHGQMGSKGWCHLLFILVSLRRRSSVRVEEPGDVHRRQILRRHGKLGLPRIQ